VTIKKYFDEISIVLPEIEISILLINDGSIIDLTSGLKELSMTCPLTIIANKDNKGKGYSIRKAISTSRADYIIFTDVDFPYTTKSFERVFSTLQNENFDVALGVRDEDYYDEIPQSRMRISKLLKSLNQKLMNLITTDTQCGLKGMTQKGKEILLQTKQNRYLIDLEFIKLLSKRKDVKTKLVTVELRAGVSFSTVAPSKIMGETLSFFKVLFRR